MAEPAAPDSTRSVQSPGLASTADQVPYVPVSWLAVAAAGTALLLGLLLAGMGIVAVLSRRPLLEEELLIFAIVAIVLSFAARRVIRNSEGTRTGLLFGVDLPNAAWWGGLVLGLGYISYLLAIEYSIRKDAQSEVQTWSAFVMKGDDESMNRAFHRTQDPSQRKNVPPADGAQLEARWGKEYIAFRQSDLRRLIARNPDSCNFEIGGLREWRYLPTGIESVFTATLTCPEGSFPLLIPMRGVEGAAAGTDAGRQWQIMHYPSGGYIDKQRARMTPYGWLVAQLGMTGMEAARGVLAMTSGGRDARASVYVEFGADYEKHADFYRPLTMAGYHARAAVLGFPASGTVTAVQKYFDHTANLLYKLPGGAEPDAARAETFRKVWSDTGIVKAGERLRDSADVNDQIVVTETAVYYRSPIEIPLAAMKGEILAARGGLVLQCTDPAILAEVKRLRSSADPKTGTESPDVPFDSRTIPWRLLRIESDLKPVRMEPPKSPGAPPPGGPPPPNEG